MKIDSLNKADPITQPVRKQAALSGALFVILLMLVGLAIPVAVNKFGILTMIALIGIILFIGIFLQPEIGMLVYVLFTFTQFSNVAIETYGAPSLIQPLAALLLLVISIRIFLYGERPLGWTWAVPMFILYVMSWVVSLLSAQYFSVATDTLIADAKRVLGGVIVLYFIQRPETVRRAIWAIVISGAIMGTISAFQNLTGTYDNNYWGFGNWFLTEDVNTYSRHRLIGPYGSPNAYAQVLVVIVALAFERFLHEKKRLLRFLAGWSVAVCTLTIFFTYSRGSGFLNLIFTLGVFFFFYRGRALLPSIIAIVFGMVLIQFLPSTYLVRINTLTELLPSSSGPVTDQSFRSRLNENTAAWNMFLDHPLLGVGLGNFRYTYSQYAAKSGFNASSGPVASPSLYAELLSEQGLFGTTIFFILMFHVFNDLLRARKQAEAAGLSELTDIATAFFAAMAGYMFSGIFKQSAYSNVFWILVCIAIAISQVAQQQFRSMGDASNSSPGSVL